MARVVTVQGLDEVVKKLEAIQKGYAAANLRPVFLRGAETMASIIKSGAPRLTGKLERSIVAKLGRNRDTVVAWALSDVNSIPNPKRDARGRPYRYPYMVEAGAGVHVIKPRKKGGRLKIGGTFVQSVVHPGFAPRRFFARGVARGRSIVRAQILRELQEVFRRATA